MVVMPLTRLILTKMVLLIAVNSKTMLLEAPVLVVLLVAMLVALLVA
jgi:hypothetical protein